MKGSPWVGKFPALGNLTHTKMRSGVVFPEMLTLAVAIRWSAMRMVPGPSGADLCGQMIEASGRSRDRGAVGREDYGGSVDPVFRGSLRCCSRKLCISCLHNRMCNIIQALYVTDYNHLYDF